MSKIKYQQASFLTSAAKLSQLPPDQGTEVAFAGRSNVGKSSALNVLTQQRQLARTSKTPGRTQLINLFELDKERRLVDLPGYGYAKVSREIKQRWQATLAQYLESRQCLKGIVLLMDIRHPLKEFDLMMLEWADNTAIPLHILLTKSDKLSRGAAMMTLKKIEREIGANPQITLQLFSSLKRVGIDKLKQQLAVWFSA